MDEYENGRPCRHRYSRGHKCRSDLPAQGIFIPAVRSFWRQIRSFFHLWVAIFGTGLRHSEPTSNFHRNRISHAYRDCGRGAADIQQHTLVLHLRFGCKLNRRICVRPWGTFRQESGIHLTTP